MPCIAAVCRPENRKKIEKSGRVWFAKPILWNLSKMQFYLIFQFFPVFLATQAAIHRITATKRKTSSFIEQSLLELGLHIASIQYAMNCRLRHQENKELWKIR